MNVHYGEKLRTLIRDFYGTQREFSKKTGTREMNVSYWCSLQYPPIKVIEKVCNLLNITLSDFFKEK